MRSQVRTVMAPADESDLVAELLREPSVLLVDGPRWKTSTPPSTRNIKELSGRYCIVWSPEDLAKLDAEFIAGCNDWYCRSEFATIQFLRSEADGANALSEGRIEVSTPENIAGAFSRASAIRVENRFKRLRAFIRKHFRNNAIQWWNPNVPIAPAGKDRSANPGAPSKDVWVGRAALEWLAADAGRYFVPAVGSSVKGVLCGRAGG